MAKERYETSEELRFIGGRIRELMKERGISSIKMAEMVNMNKVTISYILNSKIIPPVETLNKFARALDVPLWMVVAPKEDMDNSSVGNVAKCPYCGKSLTVELGKM